MTSVVTPETLSKSKPQRPLLEQHKDLFLFFFNLKTTEYLEVCTAQLVALNGQSRSLLLRAATLYGYLSKIILHTKGFNTWAGHTVGERKHRVRWSEIRQNCSQAGGLYVFEHSVVDHLRHSSKDL